MDKYVLLEDVEELMKLVNERELIADYVDRYMLLSEKINDKIRKIRDDAEEIYKEG